MEKKSDQISAAHGLLQKAAARYEALTELVHTQDLLRTDIEHVLELEPQNRDGYAKLARELRDCQRVRRQYKDEISLLEPLVNFMAEPANAQVVGRFAQLIGEMRRKENNLQNRRYVPRVRGSGGEPR